MIHFGRGGLVDHILSEIAWLRLGTNDFTGSHKAGQGGYEYEAPGYWWDFMCKRFNTSGLRRNLAIR